MASGFRGKRKEEEEYASEGEFEGQAPPKKRTFNSNSNSKKDSDDDSADNIVVCEISRNRRVTVRTWQGKVVVDIREYYNKDGKQLPGKKVESIGTQPLCHNFEMLDCEWWRKSVGFMWKLSCGSGFILLLSCFVLVLCGRCPLQLGVSFDLGLFGVLKAV
uniref:Transcriptional coactivator p15 (PC4) C-terminal domain-containing protein n=1 Tax=Quercus lobata TaxID=97700 RepID=A0A7N2MS45_QUELO